MHTYTHSRCSYNQPIFQSYIMSCQPPNCGNTFYRPDAFLDISHTASKHGRIMLLKYSEKYFLNQFKLLKFTACRFHAAINTFGTRVNISCLISGPMISYLVPSTIYIHTRIYVHSSSDLIAQDSYFWNGAQCVRWTDQLCDNTGFVPATSEDRPFCRVTVD